MQDRDQFFQGEFSFSDDDDVGSGGEILVDVRARLGTTYDCLPARVLGHTKNLDHIRPSHQIGVHAQH
jgi:hypothetical protein